MLYLAWLTGTVVAMLSDPLRLMLCVVIGLSARSYLKAFGWGAIVGLIIVAMVASYRSDIGLRPMSPSIVGLHILVSALFATSIFAVLKAILPKGAKDA